MTHEIARILDERQLTRLAAQDVPCVREALASISPECVVWAPGASKDDIAAADCGVIEALALIADTGAVVSLLPTYGERLLPYLPRVCIIVGDVDALCPHLGGFGLELIARAARDGVKGEAAVIAGPSKSADIERILVLGAHGPQTVMVFISGSDATAAS
jgi:L-lactate dehydrogenase complex protein LldG